LAIVCSWSVGRRIVAFIVVAATLLAVGGCSTSPDATAHDLLVPKPPTGSAEPAPDATGAAVAGSTPAGSRSDVAASPSLAAATTLLAAAIASLPVADDHRGGYRRDLFRLWIDADGNGCNTRNEVLIAEAIVPPAIGAHCRLTGGRWISAYDGVTVNDPARLQIDHLVPLAEAWASGAWAWTATQREAYANDLGLPSALIAVTSATNQAKSDRDPAEWMPPLASDACTYVADWVAVKVRWKLTVDPAEERALQHVAAGCPSTLVPALPSNGPLP
jgi:hypothetical protein